MRIWRISKETGVLKNYLRGPRCARAAYRNDVYFAISISICAISTVMIKNPEISITVSTFVFAFNRRSALLVYFPPQTSAQTQSPNEVLPLTISLGCLFCVNISVVLLRSRII